MSCASLGSGGSPSKARIDPMWAIAINEITGYEDDVFRPAADAVIWVPGSRTPGIEVRAR